MTKPKADLLQGTLDLLILKASRWVHCTDGAFRSVFVASRALFSAVNELLLAKLPVADPDGLVRLRWAGENDMVNRHDEWGASADTAAGEPTRASFSLPPTRRSAGCSPWRRCRH